MGFVSIPTSVNAGRVVASVELSEEELRVSIDLLKVAVNAYCQQQAIQTNPVQETVQQSALQHSPVQPQARSEPIQQQRQPTPQQPSYGSSNSSSARQQHQQQVRATEQRAPNSWSCCWSTSPSEHGAAQVSGLVFRDSFEGLAGGDGHGGWLVSSSRASLNLWECSASGGKGGEPSLQLMHQIALAETAIKRLDYDAATGLLLAPSADARPQTRDQAFVALYHMDAGPRGMPLRYKSGVRFPRAGGTPSARNLQPMLVASLSPLEGPMTKRIAMAQGSELAVVSLEQVGVGTDPSEAFQVQWRAAAPVTAMATVPSAKLLLTGTAEGSVLMWDLRQKQQAAPAAQCSAGGQVSALCMVGDTTMLAGTLSGVVCSFDLRSARGAATTAKPTGQAITRIAVSPLTGAVAAATADGVAATAGRGAGGAGLGEGAWHGLPLAAAAAAKGRAVADVAWSSATGELYVACGDGSIAVMRQTL